MIGDPLVISPRGEWFAWRPVRLHTGGWAWLRRVRWMRPLGMVTEYYPISSAWTKVELPCETPLAPAVPANGVLRFQFAPGSYQVVSDGRFVLEPTDGKRVIVIPATQPGSQSEPSEHQRPQDLSEPR